ncbi:hypothetical protein [Gordonia ajococcus]|uniref:hypothetical protein n=1 Tax=Gordonia TaxID=2053 RepID=UPI00177F9134
MIAQIEIALGGVVLGDVGQPQTVRSVGGEALNQIIMNRRPGSSAVAAPFCVGHRPPGVVTADPPRRPLAHGLTSVFRVSDEEVVAELRVLTVSIEKGLLTAPEN